MKISKIFRVRDLKTNKLHDQSNPSTHLLDSSGLLWHFYPGGTLYAWKDAAPEFSSGLFDANEQEIYENDILKLVSERETWIGLVKFVNGKFVFSGFPGFIYQDTEIGTDLDLCQVCKFKIIGNVKENPELLRKE